MVAYALQTSALRGKADTLLDAASYGSRCALPPQAGCRLYGLAGRLTGGFRCCVKPASDRRAGPGRWFTRVVAFMSPA